MLCVLFLPTDDSVERIEGGGCVVFKPASVLAGGSGDPMRSVDRPVTWRMQRPFAVSPRQR